MVGRGYVFDWTHKIGSIIPSSFQEIYEKNIIIDKKPFENVTVSCELNNITSIMES